MGGWPGLVADLPLLLYHTPQVLQSPLETRPLKSVDQEFANWPHQEEKDGMAVAEEEEDEMRRAGQEDSL